MNKTDSDETFKVKKGVRLGVGYAPGLQRWKKGWLKSEEELKTIEED
ncbi:MAG: hypothetical protein WAM42_00640 [Candidatus Nitrosopolaris sp.]